MFETRPKFVESDVVTIKVGPAATCKTFYVHSALFPKDSFFAKAIKGNFVEASSRVIELPEDSAETVENFCNSLYHSISYGCNLAMLFRLWIFGDKYAMPNFQDDVMRRIIMGIKLSGNKHRIKACEVKDIYKGTMPKSPLRKAIVDISAWHLSAAELELNADAFPRDFLVDLACAWRRRMGSASSATEAASQISCPIYLRREHVQNYFKRHCSHYIDWICRGS